MAGATSSHPSLPPITAAGFGYIRVPPWGEGAGGAPGAVVMAKHFPPSDSAVAPRRAQGAPGAVAGKWMVAASTQHCRLSLIWVQEQL